MRLLEHSHPLCCFVYIISVLAVTVFTRDPLLLGISVVGAALLLILSGRGKTVLLMPLFVLLSAVTNPIFSHNGATVLFFVGDVAVTLESVAYGAVFGMMLCACVGWSIAAVRFITSDKYLWLFGRLLPVSGLVLSCALRLVPLSVSRAREFAAAQGATTLRGVLKAYSASIGYSAENAMLSADSMRARGYGTARRTSYLLYRMGRREALQLAIISVLGGASVVLAFLGFGGFGFYPRLTGLALGAGDILLYSVFTLLCMMPCAVVFKR